MDEFAQAKAYRAEGIAYQKKGQPDNALFAYAKALSLDPDDAETYYGRGTALLQRMNPTKRLSPLKPLFASTPHTSGLSRNSLRLYPYAGGGHRPPLALWDQFLARQPQHGRGAFLNRPSPNEPTATARDF